MSSSNIISILFHVLQQERRSKYVMFRFQILDVDLYPTVLVTAHNITLLEVPVYGDPRAPVQLRCQYARGSEDPLLHSVKWYHDNDEIFRYTPGQKASEQIDDGASTPAPGATEAMQADDVNACISTLDCINIAQL
ncbi:hypothetical protein EVAR_64593_1 [Eumeta japonica]|uniref:Ig-like domain-containing protein n=1 Tax=Eumeta variegata TaxID=151549 RepID=A0A4C1Z7Z3_EUMVA|nr:hypothetical protein EVAR_64593_1 [Eumeta japonica]